MLEHLRNKTRVLVTHQLQFLPFADCIIVMQNGAIKHQGSYDELMKKGVELSSIVTSHKEKLQKIRSSSKLKNDELQALQAEKSLTSSPKSSQLKEELRRAATKTTSKENIDSILEEVPLAKEKPKKEEHGKLTTEEDMDNASSIGLGLYTKYFRYF
jgi:ATP-binding cassette subfamily C (CFTR/MRP) protein 1